VTTADPTQLTVARQVDRSDILFSLARSAESGKLFVGSSDGRIHPMHLDDAGGEREDDRGATEAFSGHQGYVMEVLLLDGQVISGAYDGRMIWWEVESGRQIRVVDAHDKWIRAMAVTPDGKTIASVADDMVCRLWSSENGQLLHQLYGHQTKTPTEFPSMLFCCAVSTDGQFLATGDKVGHVVIWEIATGQELISIDAPLMYTWDSKQRIHSIGGIRSLAFSPDDRLIAVGGIGQIGNVDHLGALARVEVFDWQKGERTHEFAGDTYKGLVEHLEFHPEGHWLMATGGDHDGFIKFFDLEQSKVIKQEKAPMHVHHAVIGETSDKIYAVGHGKIVVWQM
jgi:WD40 repeat protein